jgi:hypothetical protein
MALTLTIFEISFAALCVWLGVRIFNRRERWSKRALVITVLLPALYVASFGPACWLCQRWLLPQRAAWIAYRPLTWLAVHGHETVRGAIRYYTTVCGDKQPIFVSQSLGVERCYSSSPSPVVYEFLFAKYETLLAKQPLPQRESTIQAWRQHRVVYDPGRKL